MYDSNIKKQTETELTQVVFDQCISRGLSAALSIDYTTEIT